MDRYVSHCQSKEQRRVKRRIKRRFKKFNDRLNVDR